MYGTMPTLEFFMYLFLPIDYTNNVLVTSIASSSPFTVFVKFTEYLWIYLYPLSWISSYQSLSSLLVTFSNSGFLYRITAIPYLAHMTYVFSSEHRYELHYQTVTFCKYFFHNAFFQVKQFASEWMKQHILFWITIHSTLLISV